ncbi:MAG: hypothetical protein QXE81_05895 [Desulfurococcaceae archaeon]
MNRDNLIKIVERIERSLRARDMVIKNIGIKDKQRKYEIYINLYTNPLRAKKIKIIIAKHRYKYRVYSGLKSLDLAIKRAIAMELSRKGVGDENTP